MLKDLVVRNRSYRGFDESRPIARADMLEFVDLTRFTASSVNLQPLKYAVVSDRNLVEEMVKLTRWAGALPEWKLPLPGKHPTGFILVCQDTRVSAAETMFLKDVGVVAQTILLAAAEKGFGGCMIGSFDAEGIKALLSLPAQVQPKLAIALGVPAEKIVLAQVGEDGKTTYFRDADGTHFVPKRALEDIVL